MNKWKQRINKFFQGRYGLDELGKAIIIADVIIYVLGLLLQSGLLMSLAMVGIIYAFYRVVSKQHWDRSEENRKYTHYTKLWKLRYQERKSSRIYICKSCGRYIRVPKGKGKIQVTCTACGSKSIHRT